ncbi:MAG: CapA family protein [Bacteroidales bacterium]|nr:CapA family protein [Bacteroidales bacterium]
MIIALAFLSASLSAGAQLICPMPKARPLFGMRDTTSIFIIGDVMMHSRQLEYDQEWFLKYISPAMTQADFCLANMEFPLGGPPYTGYPVFSTPDSYPEYVARCGADVFLLANNHVLDKGLAGFKRTLRVYDRMADSLGIRCTGVGDEPLMLHRRGLCVALVNFSYGTNIGPETSSPDILRMRKDDVGRAIRKAKDRGADFIVALPHWGVEYSLTHSESQAEWARWLAKQGCCAVVGAHPHVVQDTTHIAGVPVIYSMGNAVSNMSATNTRLELAVTLRFVHDHVTGEMLMLEPELDWMWCTLPDMLTRSYATVFIKEWATRRSEWLNPSDFDNMMATLERVRAATGIDCYLPSTIAL